MPRSCPQSAIAHRAPQCRVGGYLLRWRAGDPPAAATHGVTGVAVRGQAPQAAQRPRHDRDWRFATSSPACASGNDDCYGSGQGGARSNVPFLSQA
jgi:hypothetical protein